MGLQVAAAGKIINELTGLAFAGGEFETDNPAIRFVSAEAWTKDAQGAHIVFATAPIGSSSPVEGMRLTSEGILLVGTDTASGSAKLQVSGAISGSSLAASQGTGGTETAIQMSKASSISASNVLYAWSHRSNDTDMWLYRSNGSTYKNLLKFIYNAGTDQVMIAADTEVQLSFFGVTPVARPAAPTAADNSALNTGDATSDAVIGNMRTRLGEVVTALQNIGLLS